MADESHVIGLPTIDGKKIFLSKHSTGTDTLTSGNVIELKILKTAFDTTSKSQILNAIEVLKQGVIESNFPVEGGNIGGGGG